MYQLKFWLSSPAQLAPEHTLMSFRKALEQKLYGLQADVTIR